MLLLLLILIPLITGVISFFIPKQYANGFAFISSIATLGLAFLAHRYFRSEALASFLSYTQTWIPALGSSFSLAIDSGLQILMVILTALVFPLVFLSLFNKTHERPNTFFGLMLLAQAGLMGVFLASDALVFYLFWELALIPVYFLSSMFGGEKRIPVTFKFFVYTFTGSLLLLIGFLIIYNQTPIHSFSWNSFVSTGIGMKHETQQWLFWLIFTAFAIKMPIFPFHTWQPDAYDESNTPVTIVLSAIMVKMGLFAVIKWLLPILPHACEFWMNTILVLSVIGIIYASMLAMVQTNIKRLIAYSSIAHIGLMCAAIFSFQKDLLGIQGAAIQMFNHGINILGMWLLVHFIETRLQTEELKDMGGIAKVAPMFTIALVIVSLANVALPLTNGFIGEFMMFNALFNSTSAYSIVFTVIAGIGVILSAVYTLGMIQKVAYGEMKSNMKFADLSKNELWCMVIIVAIILWLGFYPKFLMNLVNI